MGFIKPPQREHCSIHREIKNGEAKIFPCLSDYVRVLIEQGEIQDEQDLIETRPELIPEIQRDWLKRNQTGCLFASMLSRKEESGSWYDEVFLDASNPDAYDSLDKTIMYISRRAEAIQIILPKLRTPNDIINFLELLCRKSQWRLVNIPWQGDGVPPAVQTGLRWYLPSHNFVSWVLGFAPWESMPFTRRAPFISFIMRTQGPGRCPEIARHTRPVDKVCRMPSVHLADLPDGLLNEETVMRYWNRTVEEKKNLLAGDELGLVARAKITFSFPANLTDDIERLVASQTTSI